MRNIIVLSMMTLDGVVQGPGGPEEDTSGGFRYGGWTVSYGDEVFNAHMMQDLEPATYLLGRKTFEIFEAYWPQHASYWPGINDGTKYVLSQTRHQSDWNHTRFLQSLADIEELKRTDGGDIHVWGSSELIQLLLEHDLVDELRLRIYPLTLGEGKQLFGDGTRAAAFTLTKHVVTPGGVIFANYRRDGEVKTGTVGI